MRLVEKTEFAPDHEMGIGRKFRLYEHIQMYCNPTDYKKARKWDIL